MTTTGQPYISVVIPAFNEERRLGPTLESIATYLSRQPFTWEIVVVDDGSSDGTTALVEPMHASEPRISVIRCTQNSGKGHAVRVGFLESNGAVVLFSDADCSTPIEEFERLRAAIDAGADVAIGSRAMPDSDVRVRQGVIRQTMGKTFNLLVRLATGLRLHDTQCGFKLFRRDRCLAAFRAQRLDGFAFDVELLFLAKRQGLRISEVPVAWVNSPDSRVHMVRDSARMFRDLARIRWNAITGRYDASPSRAS